ncbi:hypothetical protein J6590_097813 [Homalodisca vitripennis]|nr:hypothetical protein J6590_097813 [Homalodisca vitripennis]
MEGLKKEQQPCKKLVNMDWLTSVQSFLEIKSQVRVCKEMAESKEILEDGMRSHH